MKYLIVSIVILFTCLSTAADKVVLEVGILAPNKVMREAYIDAKLKFEKENPDIKVKLLVKPIRAYNDSFPKWVAQKSGPDILFWYAGEQLRSYVRQGAVSAIDELWDKNQLDTKISHNFKELVSYKKKVYAIPFAYYGWGFLYRKSIFAKYKITPPKTWQEFDQVCMTLKENKVTPVSIGLKNKWPCLGWFDYLNLRINGLEFHLKLLKGEISYQHPSIRKVLQLLKDSIDKGTFSPDVQKLDWKGALSQVNNGVAGMNLIGLFA
ncbi:MAG: extracellular solute-binding protein, partial [Lentisphaeraceae bacterium]|nr:extracellular solute-binding protein [Lentisphaeraceae bacterium]